MGLGVAEGSDAQGDCLPDLGHPGIALGAGVGERGVGVAAVRSASVSYWISASKRALKASNSERSDALLTVAMGYPDSTAMVAGGISAISA